MPQGLCYDKEFFKCLFIFERERESAHKWGRGRKRGRHRIRSRIQALSCQDRARGGARTHEPRDHDLSQSQMLNKLSHLGTLRGNLFLLSRGALNPMTDVHNSHQKCNKNFNFVGSTLTMEPNTGLELRTLTSRPEL